MIASPGRAERGRSQYLLDNFDAVEPLVRHSRHPYDGSRDGRHGEVRHDRRPLSRRPKPISATAFSRPIDSLTPRAPSPSAPTAISRVSPAEDLRQLEYSQRLRDRTRNVLAGGSRQIDRPHALDAALNGGAAVDGAAGRRACARPPRRYRRARCRASRAHRAQRAIEVLDSWIFSGGNACVTDVFVAGKHVVEDRRHISEDEIAIRTSAPR